MKFNEFIINHGFENGNVPLPLWKLRLTPEEYSALKEELLCAFQGNQLFRFTKEAALFYANWWSKEYVGGDRDNLPSKEKIARDLGIRPDQSDELYYLAKRGLSNLRITPIFRNGRTHYFRTLLLQGGLPVKSLTEGKNRANYGAFLEGLIKYTNQVNIDLEDISFIDYLTCTNRLAPSFKTKDFYELNLLIIEDFREKGEQSNYWELISAIFDENTKRKIRTLISEKKEDRPTKSGFFPIEWNLRKIDPNILLFYTLTIPHKLKQTEIFENFQDKYEFSVFLNNKEIAKYNRTLPDNNGSIYFIKSRGKDNVTEKWEGISEIVIRLTSDGLFHELNHSFPDFSEPILLTGSDANWTFKKRQDENTKIAVLLLKDSDWKFNELCNTENIKFCDSDAIWVESENEIELRNEKTSDNQIFDNTPFMYRYEMYLQPDFKSKNRKLISDITRICIISNVIDEPINKGYVIYFRTKHINNWVEYINSNALPIGLLYFKFIYPDKKTEFLSFFNIGNLTVNYSDQTANTGIIQINNWNGSAQPYIGQAGIKQIEQIQNNNWEFVRDTENRHYTNNILFRINDMQGDYADIHLAPPFHGAIITDLTGNSVENDTTISLYSLWRYKCVILGSEQTSITIFHNKNLNNIRRFTYNLIKKREIPLSDFEDSIKNLFTLFGTDHTDFNSYITIEFDNNHSISVKLFNVNILKDSWMNSKRINLDNDNNINRLLAIKPDCEYPDEIDIIELQKDENGFFFTNVQEDAKGFIVFSDDNTSQDRLRPTFLPASSEIIDIRSRQDEIRNELCEARFNDFIWDNCIIYFKILTEYNLPFNTLDIFRVIAESPILCAKLAVIMLDHKEIITPEIRNNGLRKFENEFSLAWHWIDYKTWEQSIGWVRKYNDIAAFYIKDLLRNSLTNNYEAIEEFYRLFSENTIEYEPHLDEQGLIHKYTPYVDIQSEDWLIRDANHRIVYPRVNQNWQNLFNREYGSAVRTFLWGPAKAALSAMGLDSEGQEKLLWLPVNEIQRRIIFYYWTLNPEAYIELFLTMVKKINYRINHLN